MRSAQFMLMSATLGNVSRFVADFERRNQGGIAPHEGVFADLSLVFAQAIVIARDGAGADVGTIADLGIAQIGQMIGFRSRAEASVLQLHEVADARIFADAVPLPQARERSNGDARFNVRIRDARERRNFNI